MMGAVALCIAIPAGAQNDATDPTLFLRPHCNTRPSADDSMFGPVPSPPPMIELGEGRCPNFAVEDPQTLRTDPLNAGDTLDMDIVVRNFGEQKIQRVRAWIQYDPAVLEGTNIAVHDDFPEVTPGEEDFDTENGYVMIDASAETGNEPNQERPVVARIQFTVLSEPDGGTILSFYDVQQGGHTMILAQSDANSEGEYILETDPSTLLVTFARAEGETCTSDLDCIEGSCVDGACTSESGLADGSDCLIDSQCMSGQCLDGICGGGDVPLPIGSACQQDSDCQSSSCIEGICDVGAVSLLPNGSACTTHNECESFLCIQGKCRVDGSLSNGSACEVHEECESGTCQNNVCIAEPNALLAPNDATCTDSAQCVSDYCSPDGTCQDAPASEEEQPGQQTAFSLLQVRNVRVTTQGSAAYLAWDALQSSQLKGYNIYYGTTMGQYIQRKTVPGTMQSLTIQPLTEGTTYYFAIRAMSQSNEESAFSHEVAVMIGNPATSSAPFMLGADGTGTSSINPFDGGGTVPGETGAPTILILLILVSAVIGTLFASRRQMAVMTHPPRP